MSKFAALGLFGALSFAASPVMAAASPVMAQEEYGEHEHAHERHHEGDMLNHAFHGAHIPHVHFEEHSHEHIEEHHHHDEDED